jgi:hypothetical protein
MHQTSFMITGLDQIGMVDPFPQDERLFHQGNVNQKLKRLTAVGIKEIDRKRLKKRYRRGKANPLFESDSFSSDSSSGCSSDDEEVLIHDVYKFTRYLSRHSPHCIYLPTKFVMFKLMRACIDVKGVGELWFN